MEAPHPTSKLNVQSFVRRPNRNVLPADDDLPYLPDDGSDDPDERRRRTLADSGAAREFARVYLVLGTSCAKAARSVGWAAMKGHQLLRSKQWAALKQEIEEEFDLSREQVFHEINDTLVENAVAASRVQNAMLSGRVHELPDVKHDTLARVSDSALDRVGLRAPTKVDHKIEVTLDQATVGRIQQALEQFASLGVIDVNSHDLSYALAKPDVRQVADDALPSTDA